MADNSKIAWTDASWNPILGCTRVSEGCRNCYAQNYAHRMSFNPNPKIKAAYEGLTMLQNGRPNWTGVVRYLPERLDQPLRWKRPRRIFVNSMSDIGHEEVSPEAFGAIFDMMLQADWHTYQVLTKRPRYLGMMTRLWMRDRGLSWLLPSHIWLGASVEDKSALDRVQAVEGSLPARVRWLSLEPLLGPLPNLPLGGIDWVVIGGESGRVHTTPAERSDGVRAAREMKPEWVSDIIEQCRSTGTPVFVKQMGSQWAWLCGYRHKAGADPTEWPEDLRAREYPQRAMPL